LYKDKFGWPNLDVNCAKVKEFYRHHKMTPNGKAIDYIEIRVISDPNDPVYQEGHGAVAFGAFAKVDLPLGTILGEYTGEVKSILQLYDEVTGDSGGLQNEMKMVYSLDLEITAKWVENAEADQLTLDANRHSSEFALINDYRSDWYSEKYQNPLRRQNVVFLEVLVNNWPHKYVVVCEPVARGKELYVDYSSKFWEQRRDAYDRRKYIENLLEQQRKEIIKIGREEDDPFLKLSL